MTGLKLDEGNLLQMKGLFQKPDTIKRIEQLEEWADTDLLSQVLFDRLRLYLSLNDESYEIPMTSSFTSYEFRKFVENLPDTADLCVGVKVKGIPIRIKFVDNMFDSVWDLDTDTEYPQYKALVSYLLGHLNLSDEIGTCMVYGELTHASGELEKLEKGIDDCNYSDISFQAFDIRDDGLKFTTYYDIYDMLDDCGFDHSEVWYMTDMMKETLIEDITDAIADCKKSIENINIMDGVIVRYANDVKGKTSVAVMEDMYNEYPLYQGIYQFIYWETDYANIKPNIVISDKDVEDYKLTYYQKEYMDVDESNLGVSCDGERVEMLSAYQPATLVYLNLKKGDMVNFRKTTHFGYVLCDKDGYPLIHNLLMAYLSGEIDCSTTRDAKASGIVDRLWR